MHQILDVQTIEHAQRLLEELGLVIEHSETHERYVEGKALLEAMGLSFESNFRVVIGRVIESNSLVEGRDYVAVHPPKFAVTMMLRRKNHSTMQRLMSSRLWQQLKLS